MTRTKRRRDQLEVAMESALAPGAYIDYRADEWFVAELELVRAKITALIKGGEAARAAELLDTFIAGCYEKSEDVDGSSGSFGMFVSGLFADWIRARQAACAEPGETAAMLLSWIEADEYGYCDGLEKAAADALDRAGLGAFERAVRERLVGHEKRSDGRRRNIEILKAIHVRRRDVEAYAGLCEQEGELAPGVCEVLAEMCLKRRRPQDALVWVERGLKPERKESWPDRSPRRLGKLRREILKKLGRDQDALGSAWEEYRKAPSADSYEELMKYTTPAQRSAWHARALAALGGAGLSTRIEVLVKTREWTRLDQVVAQASRAALMGLSHFTTEPAAKGLAKTHPLAAAKLDIALGLRIVEAKKSRYYDAALSHLEQARKILLRQGHAAQWQELVAEVRTKHRHKYGFMPGFERLAEGGTPKREPSFLHRARKKWRRRAPPVAERP